MIQLTTFEGFPKEARTFLRDLAKHNDRSWFEEHRLRYEQHLLEPAKAYVDAMGPALRKVSRGVVHEAKIGGSIRRLYRDMRFQKDKGPYKTYLDFVFWEGGDAEHRSQFHLRMDAEELTLRAGIQTFPRGMLLNYRELLVDLKESRRLAQTLRKVELNGCQLGGLTYKRQPRGYEVGSKHGHLLLHSGLYAECKLPWPPEAHSQAFVSWCSQHWRTAAPVHKWLLKSLVGAS